MTSHTPALRDRFLDRLALAYRQGELVPFIGSGMSVATCPTWEPFVSRLEEAAGMAGNGTSADAAMLTRRADRAVQALVYRRRLAEACREALHMGSHPPIPDQTRALARTYWPLVVTTNYDDLYLLASAQAPKDAATKTRVLGRDAEDCQEIVRSLDLSIRPQLWAVQGYLGVHGHRSPESLERLAREVVVGHHQYQRVIHEDRLFRRAFAEVFRRRSLLFVGSGLSEPYFLDLFGEILHGFGPGLRPHFALMKRSEAPDADFLMTRLNVVLATYEDHHELPRLLDQLHERVRWDQQSSSEHDRGLYSVGGAPLAQEYRYGAHGAGRLRLVAEPLSIAQDRGLCVSVGRRDDATLYYGAPAKQLRARITDAASLAPTLVAGRQYVYRFGALPWFAAASAMSTPGASGDHRRDLRAVRAATRELLEVAEDAGLEHICVQLLAAGRFSPWSPIFSLVQMLEGIYEYGLTSLRPIPVTVHIVDHRVLTALAARHVPVQEILACADTRFWVEVDRLVDAPAQRVLVLRPSETSVGEIADIVGVPRDVGGWRLQVLPEPDAELTRQRWYHLEAAQASTLRELGVCSGSTVRFRFEAPSAQRPRS